MVSTGLLVPVLTATQGKIGICHIIFRVNQSFLALLPVPHGSRGYDVQGCDVDWIVYKASMIFFLILSSGFLVEVRVYLRTSLRTNPYCTCCISMYKTPERILFKSKEIALSVSRKEKLPRRSISPLLKMSRTVSTAATFPSALLPRLVPL